MPRGNSYVDDDPSTFPLHTRLAYDHSLDWRSEGHCRGYDGQLRLAWSIMPKEEAVFGDSVYLGSQLIALALEYCRVCPVQYDCARYALDLAPSHTYIWGTWGADVSDMRWVKQAGIGDAVIDVAEAEGVPVQVAMSAARRALKVAAA